VDGARDELLAGAGLAGDEHGAGPLRRPLRQLQHVAHRLADRHHAVECVALLEFASQVAVLASESGQVHCTLHQRLQLVVVEGLLHVVDGAFFHGGDRRRNAGVGRHQDHRKSGHLLARTPQHLEPVDPGHPQVGDEQVVGLRGQGGEGLRGICVRNHVVAFPPQHHGDDVHHALLVVEDE
jgi:hypothetical protein